MWALTADGRQINWKRAHRTDSTPSAARVNPVGVADRSFGPEGFRRSPWAGANITVGRRVW